MLLQMWYFLLVNWLSNVLLVTISWQHLHRLLLHLLLPVLVEGAGVVKAERTRRSLRFFGLYVTKGELGMACFSSLEACRMGRCLLMIFIKLVSPGWYVVTWRIWRGCSCRGRRCRAQNAVSTQAESG